jgi:hypothetical protein
MSAQMNKMTAATMKLHMFGVFVLQTLLTEGKLAEDFDPMSLDTSLVFKFDVNEMKNQFKTNKKTKTNVKVVSSPRENVANAIANNHYDGQNNEHGDDIVSQIVNATKSDVAEKPKPVRKPRQKKVVEPAAVDATTDSAVPASTTESAVPVVVAEKPKPVRKPRQKKVVEPAAVDATTDSAVPASTTESAVPVATAEKPKPVRKPRQKKVVEPAVVDATTDSAVPASTTESAVPVATAEKPKPVRKPRQKKVVEPAAVDATTDSAEVPEEPSNNSEKKINAMTAVNTLISAVTQPETEKASPVQPDVTTEVAQLPEVEDEVKTAEDEDEEEEIQAKIINYEGQQYLLDDNLNIYDKDTFDEIGKFNAETQKIVFN